MMSCQLLKYKYRFQITLKARLGGLHVQVNKNWYIITTGVMKDQIFVSFLVGHYVVELLLYCN